MKHKEVLHDIPTIIAIDGPAASGKSTLGKLLAERLGYLYFDTGIMYRAATLAVIRAHIDPLDEQSVSEIAEKIHIDIQKASIPDGRMVDVILNGEDVTWGIRTRIVDEEVSPVSTYGRVRAAMTEQQRRIGKQGKVVVIGRDIGTVVFPDAKIKIYLDATLDARAHRRFYELHERGEKVSLEEITANLRKRDQIDSGRSIAPLRPAEDAHIINSDNMTKDEVIEEAINLIKLYRRGYV